MSKFLVAIDGSQPAGKAFEYALDLAKRTGSSLFIINVVEEFGDLVNRWKDYDRFVKDVKHDSMKILDKYQSRSRD